MNYCREEMENRRKKPKRFKNVLLNSMGIKGVASDVRKDEENEKIQTCLMYLVTRMTKW